MAESVRQRVIPKVALPKVAPQPSVPKKDENVSSSQPPSVGPSATKVGETKSTGLAAHIGSKVRITNTLSQVFIGDVYSFDTQLVLSTGPYDYHIIPASRIAKYEIIPRDKSPSNKTAEEAAAVEKDREREAQAKVKEERLAKPPGVSNIGHKIFLMLDKTLPVRWHNKSIIVLDNVLIEPPYDVGDCKAPAKHAKQLERVKELVRNELDKMPKDTVGRRGG